MSENLESDLRTELFSDSAGSRLRDEQNYHLEKVHYWLRYEGLAPGLFFGAFWLPYGLITSILFVSAYVFTPFMLYHFWRAKYYKPIAVFSVLVLIPYMVSVIVPAGASMSSFFLNLAPLVFFFIFAWVMKLVLSERLSESRAVRDIEQAREYRAGL